MFDRSHLPPARLEFVIMTDTHYMLDPGKEAVEFENRRLQSARAEVALAQVASLQTPFVVHLGDLVQTFPGRPDFAQAVDEAQAQIARFGIDLRLAPGNHDVGDKPDPTMPTEWATAESLAAHHARFGRSWFSWDWEDLHFVVLNSQIMNTDLPEAQAQIEWAEADLTGHATRRQFLFLHMPPYLFNAHEPSLGHYDNLAQPARGWLLELAARTGVELMCGAHVHFGFYDRIPHTGEAAQSGAARAGAIRYFVTPSPAFTRPGFSELFSSPPPDQQGRNDEQKLGFFLARVHDDGTRLHFLRTGGATQSRSTEAKPVITRHPLDLPHSPLGVYLRHPLAKTGDVPVAWPSVIRQRVRNDYPLLLAQEMGVRYLRFPIEELFDDFQRARLELARAEGIGLVATLIWPPEQDRREIEALARELLDGVEVQMPGELVPAEDCLAWFRTLDAQGVATTLAPLQPHYTVAGKQHSRTQLGYTPQELRQKRTDLAGWGLSHLRALCVVRDADTLWNAVQEMPSAGPLHVDWLIPPVDGVSAQGGEQENWMAQALFMAAALPDTRIFFDPWQDLDRTMDVAHGFIDRNCNPRPAFRALKTLNTVLFAPGPALQLCARQTVAGAHVIHATRRATATDSAADHTENEASGQALWLLTAASGTGAGRVARRDLPGNATSTALRGYDLVAGTVQAVEGDEIDVRGGVPLLLVGDLV